MTLGILRITIYVGRNPSLIQDVHFNYNLSLLIIQSNMLFEECKESMIQSTGKLIHTPCFLSYLLLGGLLSPSTPPKPYHYILPRIGKQLRDFAPPSSQAKVVICLVFFPLHSFFFFNLVCSRVKWTSVLISLMHIQVILKAADQG